MEETSRKDYENSSVGWNEEAKREEMKSSELKYVLVEGTDGEVKSDEREGKEGKRGKLRGFVSMMPTFENGEAVVYCYEIHIKPYLQGFVSVLRFAISSLMADIGLTGLAWPSFSCLTSRTRYGISLLSTRPC